MDQKCFEEIKAREQAATPGPWEMENEPKGSGFFGCIHGKGGISFSGNRADNEFIAHAREDIPALIEQHEQDQQQIATLKKALKMTLKDWPECHICIDRALCNKGISCFDCRIKQAQTALTHGPDEVTHGEEEK